MKQEQLQKMPPEATDFTAQEPLGLVGSAEKNYQHLMLELYSKC
ncbi:hypothetical protein [Halobacillus seohaensis]